MPEAAPTFHPDEYKRRANLLLNELTDMGLHVEANADDSWGDFIASNDAGVTFLIGLDENGLRIRYQASFDIDSEIDLEGYASSMNVGTKVCKIFSGGNAVSLNAFYPLIPSTNESELGMFMTYLMDDVEYIHDYVSGIKN